ncbi:hypothetical protein BH09MYX1_BH09MYX1_31940 [soil metagenome]
MRVLLIAFASLGFVVACTPSARCPNDLAEITSLRLSGRAPPSDVTVFRSAVALKSAVASLAAAPGTEPQGPVAYDLEHPPPSEASLLDAFVTATDFAKNDVAVFSAGAGGVGSPTGARTKGEQVTIFFVYPCSPCGGGDPGSYYSARSSYDLANAPGAVLVRVAKGARVSVKECGECGSCPSNVP